MRRSTHSQLVQLLCSQIHCVLTRLNAVRTKTSLTDTFVIGLIVVIGKQIFCIVSCVKETPACKVLITVLVSERWLCDKQHKHTQLVFVCVCVDVSSIHLVSGKRSAEQFSPVSFCSVTHNTEFKSHQMLSGVKSC